MDHTILGKTTLEQMPPEFRHGEHRHAHKPWPVIITLMVILLFGFFWWHEMKKSQPTFPAPVATVKPSVFRQDFSEIKELQLALASIPISGYEDSF
jgi:hypothetical protein